MHHVKDFWQFEQKNSKSTSKYPKVTYNSLHCSLVYSIIYVKTSSTFIDTNAVKIHVDSDKHKLHEEIKMLFIFYRK